MKTSGRFFFLSVGEIDWIEAEGNYVRLHTGKSAYLLRETVNNLERQLDPARFLRIHRSAIANIDRIREIQQSFHGEYTVILRDGTEDEPPLPREAASHRREVTHEERMKAE